MLIFKYSKTGAAVFLPHLDTLRHMTRILRRMDIPVAYSEGFNPHMVMQMSAPLPLGTGSVSEYCFVNTSASAQEFAEKFNQNSIGGISLLQAREVEKNPNIAGKSHSAEYLIELEGLQEHENDLHSIMKTPHFSIEYYEKGGQTVKDVKDLIVKTEFVDGLLHATLRSGNVNLRADRFGFNVARMLDLPAQTLKITKIKQFVESEQGVLDVDCLFL